MGKTSRRHSDAKLRGNAALDEPAAARGAARDAARRLRAIDDQLVALLERRAQLVLESARAGRPTGQDAAASSAAGAPGAMEASEASSCPIGLDDAAIERRVASGAGALPPSALRAVLREVESGCRALVRPRRIAILGPAASYSHLAAIHRFGQSVEYVPVATIAAVFEEVDRGHCDHGVVPIENSTDGRIADTLDMFTRLPVRICGEVEMRIHHTLLGAYGRQGIREVYSRPQALSQCRNWLAKHLPEARCVEVASTSEAAQWAKQRPGTAAVASREAGAMYGLETLAENIEDNPANTTRFAVIGRCSAARTGRDRMAMLFQTAHRFGALVDALAVLKRNRLNMTWIESFPVPESDRTYLFFVELEGHETDARVRRALASLRTKALRLEVLGSYPVTEPID